MIYGWFPSGQGQGVFLTSRLSASEVSPGEVLRLEA